MKDANIVYRYSEEDFEFQMIELMARMKEHSLQPVFMIYTTSDGKVGLLGAPATRQWSDDERARVLLELAAAYKKGA